MRACLTALVVWLAVLGPAARGERFALVVGVQQYRQGELSPLDYCERDVTALADVLYDKGYAHHNVIRLTTTFGAVSPADEPTAANIRAALRRVLRNRSPDDSVLIALAGHGVQFKGSEENYFCPSDTKLSDPSTLLPISEIYRELQNSRAGFKLLLIDACRNDPLRRDDSRLEKVARPQLKPLPRGAAALFACSAGETAMEDARLAHGVFFHFVIKALSGEADLDRDGQIVLPELELYVKRTVAQYVKENIPRQKQTPDLEGRTSGLVSLVNLKAVRITTGLVCWELPPAAAKKRGGQALEVTYVHPDGPADRAGVRPGDLITAVDGKPIRQLDDLTRQIGAAGVGGRLVLSTDRAGTVTQAALTLAVQPPDADRLAAFRKAALAGNAEACYQLALGLRGGRGGLKLDPAEAARFMKKAADAGHVPAQRDLGWGHLYGRGVKQDAAAAARYLRLAAKKGDPASMEMLGGSLEKGGPGLKADLKEAALWYRRGAEAGHALAAINLGRLHDEGLGVKKDEAEALRWYRRAAELGHPFAMNRLGWRLARGQGTQPNHAEAAKWYEKARERGNMDAQVHLANLYREGKGVRKDNDKAQELMSDAADAQNVMALHDLGWWYEKGLAGVKKDPKRAITLYRRAAESGWALSAFSLHFCYFNGVGVRKSETLALEWCRRAAEGGLAAAPARLGWLYETGRGTKADAAEAVRWYRKSADQGEAAGQAALAWLYLTGRGVKKDVREAARLYRLAADQGNLRAAHQLGWMLINGEGVARDTDKGVALLYKAVESGDPVALSSIGLLHARGIGKTKDLAQAAKWYRRAADKGHAASQVYLAELYARGLGVKKDEAKAAEWLRKAVNRDDLKQVPRDGWYLLGVLHEFGTGVSKDPAEARRLYRLAANEKHPAASYRLARLYRDGVGGPAHAGNAFKRMRAAAEAGFAPAMTDLAAMYDAGKGTTRDAAEARRWREKAKQSARKSGPDA